jgi:hypothetical protein
VVSILAFHAGYLNSIFSNWIVSFCNRNRSCHWIWVGNYLAIAQLVERWTVEELCWYPSVTGSNPVRENFAAQELHFKLLPTWHPPHGATSFRITRNHPSLRWTQTHHILYCTHRNTPLKTIAYSNGFCHDIHIQWQWLFLCIRCRWFTKNRSRMETVRAPNVEYKIHTISHNYFDWFMVQEVKSSIREDTEI